MKRCGTSYPRRRTSLRLANRDPANPGKTLADIPVYFEHNFTSVGRMQQLGLELPQSSKLMREVLLPTWANIDLSDREGSDFQYFSGLAQGLGLKVEKMLVADSGAMVREQLDDPAVYGAAVDVLREFLRSDNKTLTPNAIATIKQQLGGENTPHAFHALMEYARFKEAEADELKSFDFALHRSRWCDQRPGECHGYADARPVQSPVGTEHGQRRAVRGRSDEDDEFSSLGRQGRYP